MIVLLALVLGPPLLQDADREDFRIEGTAEVWWIVPDGRVTSRGVPVDLITDLGMTEREPQFAARLTFQPARRNRILFEGILYRFEARQTVTASFTFEGETFDVAEPIDSRLVIDYLFAGYQRDVVSAPAGHLGFLAGVGYLDGDASVRSETLGVTLDESTKTPFPLIGASFRAFPWPTAGIHAAGQVKGLPLGRYGHYFQAELTAGIGLGRRVTLQGGYSWLDADVHNEDETRGVVLEFRGPTVSIQFRDR